MGFKKLSVLFLISIISFLSLSSLCVGLDEGGCLFCHQYPGMVRLERSDILSDIPSGKLKILHIDEEDFLNSTHGDLSCQKCHTTIKSVPHTGESEVNCTTSCHKEDEELEMIKDFPLQGFHEYEQSHIVSLNDKSSCAVCHQLYPHSANKSIRAFLNMHTGFMRCEVCHIKKSEFKEIFFDWENNQIAQFSGKPFGTFYNPKTKNTEKNQNALSRITAFSFKGDKKNNLTNRVDITKANAFMTKEKTMTPDETEQAILYFHRDIEKKEISVACSECHSADSIMNFTELGFNKKKANNLINIDLKGLVTKYKIFYFPNLFE